MTSRRSVAQVRKSLAEFKPTAATITGEQFTEIEYDPLDNHTYRIQRKNVNRFKTAEKG